MKRALIAVVDAGRGRLFAYEDDGALRELRDFVNPERTARTGDIMSSTEPGRGLAADGGTTRGYQRSATDDHRDDSVAMQDRKFAKTIVESVAAQMSENGFHHVVMIAPPKMLGELRQVDSVLHRDGIQLDEVQQDLTKLTPAQLHDHLASMGLISGRPRMAAAR